MYKFSASRVLVIAAVVLMASIGGFGQKKDALLNESASLEQCRNGNPVNVPCTGSAWVTGNVGASNSHWSENDFVPYRMMFGDLATGPDAAPGTVVHTVIIGYDIKHSGAHALDYLGTYDTTDAGANPCSGVAGCGGVPTTIPITADTGFVTNQPNPNTGGNIVQILGQEFTMWGGTLRSFAYTAFDGPITNAQVERQVTLTFTAQVPNPVLAWSGHIGFVGDWGVGQSAVGINGSPYHMRLIDLNGSGGNQDRSLSAGAVDPSAAVFIKKVVDTPSGSSNLLFQFTATSGFNPLNFALVDDNAGPGVDTQGSLPINSFGPGNSITVTEYQTAGFTLADVNCVESGFQDSTKSPFIGPATIIVQPSEVITCTFSNQQSTTTAAPASVTGRVFDANGAAIRGARVSVTNGSTGATRTVYTNTFGYYTFTDLEVGELYVITVAHKRYTFAENTRSFTLEEDLVGYDFHENF